MKTNNHHRALLALGLIPNIGQQRIKLLLQHVKTASDIFSLNEHQLRKIEGIGSILVRQIIHFDQWKKVDLLLRETEQLGAKLIGINDSAYPPLLRHIYDAPPYFWYKGNLKALTHPGIAVVGTRSPDAYGLEQAERWTERLIEAGLSVNSGLAYGIDSAAHKTAVRQGGITVGVLGSGIDRIYPSKNVALVKQILDQGGGVMTEFPPGTKPDAGNFPVRNRIVSGMSYGVLVVQSGLKGGSMITARCALDQNREVFVIPHRVDHEIGAGCNYLIKSGQGKLMQHLEDLLVEIPHEFNQAKAPEPVRRREWESADLSEESKVICQVLETNSLHIDQLSDETGKPGYELLSLLLDLELSGYIRQKAGKYFELV